MFDVTCICCGSNKIKYKCKDCGVYWCEKCAKEKDLIELKK